MFFDDHGSASFGGSMNATLLQRLPEQSATSYCGGAASSDESTRSPRITLADYPAWSPAAAESVSGGSYPPFG
jgi:hypothetical protein